MTIKKEGMNMTINDAIDELQFYERNLPREVNDRYIYAIKLGIEALKHIKYLRGMPLYPFNTKLPGETPEEGHGNL